MNNDQPSLADTNSSRLFDHSLHESLLTLERERCKSGESSENITQFFDNALLTQKRNIALALFGSGFSITEESSPPALSTFDDFAGWFDRPLPSKKEEWEELILANIPEVSQRFELMREIGSGGMGIVYEVRDRERDAKLAMKFLLRPYPEQLLCFKQEFRSLCHLAHPNLVRLFEFFHKDRLACFTMEYIEGTDLLSWWDRAKLESGGETPFPLLRDVLLQAGIGLNELHSDGKLHRDIKPSNIMVNHSTGRAVILDFGLVANYADRLGLFNFSGGVVGGTIPYMAPEQMSGQGLLDSSSDWYSFGVLLYEMLASRHPFAGGYTEITDQKMQGVFAPLPDSIPSDLAALCTELLKPDSEQRPTFGRINHLLAGDLSRNKADVSSQSDQTEIFGRKAEFAILHKAFRKSLEGNLVVAQIHGASGIGKSSMIDLFRKEIILDSNSDPVIFSGRCYEQESVPYKGIDEVVDQISIYLANLSPELLESVLPENFEILRTVFPVFNLIGKDPTINPSSMLDPATGKDEMLGAFRDLMENLSKHKPVILILDDLQWSDSNCISLVDFLLHQTGRFPIFMICSYRREESEQNEPLASLKRKLVKAENLIQCNVPIDELDQASLSKIALKFGGDHLYEQKIMEIVTESKGSPFFLMQLASSVKKGNETVDLNSILNRRLEELNSGERCFLELIALAGRPLSRKFIITAAQLGENEHQVESNLRTDHWIKSSGSGIRDTIESYHDRIREGVVEAIGDEKKRIYHGRLADSLVGGVIELSQGEIPKLDERRRTDVHPAIIAHHYTQSGRIAEAIPYWRQASTQSMQRSAYDEAVAQADRGLSLLDQLPSSQSMIREEFLLSTTKATVLISTKGYSAEEVGIELSRAARLFDSLEDSIQQFPALCGLWVFTLMRSRLTECKEYAETLLRIAEGEGDSSLLIEGHWRLGATYYWFGDFPKALFHLQKAVDMYDPAVHRKNTYIYGQDPGVAAMVYITFVLCYAGDFQKGRMYQEKAMKLAKEIDHPHTMGWALGGATMFRLGMGDFQGTIEVGEPTIEFCKEHSQGFWLVVANMLVGWARVHTGDVETGMAMVESGFQEYQQMGAHLIQPFFYTVLADCSARKGDFVQAMAQIELGLAMADENQELNAKPGLLLAKGGLMSQGENPDFEMVEQILVEALQMSESQGSKLRSLQAAGALANLYTGLNRKQDAENILAPIKEWLSHNAGREVNDLARQFLGGFAQSET